MLLSNMCKNDGIATKVLAMEAKPVAGLSSGTTAVAQLADIFLKGTDKSYNPNCTYDFLASVFATLAAVRFAVDFFFCHKFLNDRSKME
jgi:hypothetical protein